MVDIELNSAQKQVVKHKTGPLLVVAGAGTGKTRVIVERIHQLLQDGVAAKQILAVTFTEKAASEMFERLLSSTKHYQLELPIMTFNAFGESLLREFNTDIGLSRSFLLMGENAKKVFIAQHLDKFKLDYFSPINNPTGQLPDVADYFSQLKQHFIEPTEYREFVDAMPKANDEAEKLEHKKHYELANAYATYIQICQENDVIDYDDQIYLCIQLLKTRPNVRKLLQERYKYIMIDEFQDTNPMQSLMIDLLVSKEQNLMVVGDDDQSIYGFRGATLANILDFKDRYKTAKEVTLTENYRSTQAILNTTYQLIQNNNPHRLEAKLAINKQLVASKKGKAPALEHFPTLDDELNWICQDIAKRIEDGEDPGSIAVLCRRNNTIELISEKLRFFKLNMW